MEWPLSVYGEKKLHFELEIFFSKFSSYTFFYRCSHNHITRKMVPIMGRASS